MNDIIPSLTVWNVKSCCNKYWDYKVLRICSTKNLMLYKHLIPKDEKYQEILTLLYNKTKYLTDET